MALKDEIMALQMELETIRDQLAQCQNERNKVREKLLALMTLGDAIIQGLSMDYSLEEELGEPLPPKKKRGRPSMTTQMLRQQQLPMP